MKTILVCNQKGGVGKSLIADELAFSFERTKTPFSFFDLDNQGGVLHKSQDMPDSEAGIVDTPGALQAELGKWIASADLIIVPIKVSIRDIDPFLRVAELIAQNAKPNTKTLAVINGFNRFKACRDFKAWLSEKVPGECIATLPQAEIFIHAAAAGKSVVEMDKNSPAAKQVIQLCNLARQHLGLGQE